MGFTFRKLYPSLYVDCCTLALTLPYARGCSCPSDACIPNPQPDGACFCPGFYGTDCTLNSGCGTCNTFICPPGWGSGGGFSNLDLCALRPGVVCEQIDPYSPGCTIVCESSTDFWWRLPEHSAFLSQCCADRRTFNPLCPNAPSPPFSYFNSTFSYFGNLGIPCETKGGAAPNTYSIENPLGATDQYPCQFLQSGNQLDFYLTYNLGGYSPSIANGPTAYFGDIAFYKERAVFPYKGVDSKFLRLCLQQHPTPTQLQGIENRTMVLSGKNVYNYAGHFADPRLGATDPFWDNPGGSGIKQLEQTILKKPSNPAEGNRTFPLLDYYSSLPLWGAVAQNNSDYQNRCVPTHYDCGEGNNPSMRCFGCDCLRVMPSVANVNDPTMVGIGHYLSNDAFGDNLSNRGYTAGYFSFAEFNPHCYLDHLDLGPMQANPNVAKESLIVYAGTKNALGFGNAGQVPGYSYPGNEGIRFNCNENGTNCVGCPGATSHGFRLGAPSCSVWSLMKALYSRVFYAVRNNIEDQGAGGFGLSGCTEAQFRSTFARFSSAIDNMLNDDPQGTIGGKTSKVPYHMAKVQEALYLDSAEASAYPGDPPLIPEEAFWFTYPNVFLWDRAAYEHESITPQNRWKYIFIPGNGNVLYDSGSVTAGQPFQFLQPTNTYLHEDIINQDYISSIITLNSATHSLSSSAGGKVLFDAQDPDLPGGIPSTFTPSGMARLIVFPGSGGPRAVFSSNVFRRNAKASIRLNFIPVCNGITASDGTESGVVNLSVCSLCNGSLRYGDDDYVVLPCVQDRSDPSPMSGTGFDVTLGGDCDTVTEINDRGSIPGVDFLFCSYNGGLVPEFNSLTASFQIP